MIMTKYHRVPQKQKGYSSRKQREEVNWKMKKPKVHRRRPKYPQSLLDDM